ncbi:Ldh family oxidoreductase [Streptomyces sp. ISL-98]|uniref:Ldh family oxidoreductase n=1 Tax=Streptomyces sp. ISL-98 TaxID=2819192 RepID=UPI001BE77638|nr:Ldh family oxidoreductase [Streptomyces sp. ISL-98]MBT2510079.1 Ldh family oxidoreductase [Streptomyces sp. ISL-98]
MTVTVPLTDLTEFVQQILLECGLDGDSARTAADVITYADANGFTTHGTNGLVNIYAPRLLDGRISASAEPRIVRETAATALLDGDRGLGLVTMDRAMDIAMDKARQTGIGMVAVRNSTHFGSAGYYTQRAAAAGLIGIAMTNCGAQGVAPPLGGTVRMLGTNPLSAAVPVTHGAPFVLDMSTTVVATGKIKAAHKEGRPVPEEWLVRHDGTPTTDPGAFMDEEADVAWLGGPAATGGAKGFGLALLVDLLCGPLSGASYGPRPGVLNGEPAGDDNVGHTAIVIDPAAFGSAPHIAAENRTLLDTVANSPVAAYANGVTYPGAPEAARYERSVLHGVELPDPVAEGLVRLAEQLSTEAPVELTERVLEVAA